MIEFFTTLDEDTAYNVAAENNENDDEGWTYTAVRKGKYYRVSIHDEDGAFVGYL